MDQVNRKQFAEAVATAISSVQHLYREVDRLIATLREALAQEPEALGVVRGTLGKSGRDPGRVVIRNEYGLLFEPITDEDEGGEGDKLDDADDEAEEGEDNEDGDGGGRRRRQKPVELATDQRLLAVRVALAEAQSAEGFEPCLQYAVLGDWGLGAGGAQPKGPGVFVLRRNMFRKVARVLGSKGDLTKRVVTRARIVGAGKRTPSSERYLSCRVQAGVHSVPLYDLDGSGPLDRLATEIKDHWVQVVSGGGAGN